MRCAAHDMLRRAVLCRVAAQEPVYKPGASAQANVPSYQWVREEFGVAGVVSLCSTRADEFIFASGTSRGPCATAYK